MTFGPATKSANKKKKRSKIFRDDVLSANCDVIVIFPIFGQFRAIQKPDFECRVCKI